MAQSNYKRESALLRKLRGMRIVETNTPPRATEFSKYFVATFKDELMERFIKQDEMIPPQKLPVGKRNLTGGKITAKKKNKRRKSAKS